MNNNITDPEFELLLEFLKQSRGFDFSGYKRSSLMRRVTKRMDAVRIDNFARYQEFLETNPDEFTQLFNTILINVTSFFRDAAMWESIQATVIPSVLAFKRAGEPIRVWSAGCASGQETYSLA